MTDRKKTSAKTTASGKAAGRKKTAAKKPAASRKTTASGKGSRGGKTLRATGGRATGGRSGGGRSGGGSRKRKTAKTQKRGLLKTLFLWAVTACVWGGIALAGLLAYYAWDLPDVGNMEQISRRPSVTLMSDEGIRLASYGDLYGEVLYIDDVPKHLPQAIIAIEDRRFYSHFGIDPLGIARAAWYNIKTGRLAHGGSTITQQLAKNLFLSSERSLKRKIQEAMLAIWLEQKFTKDQILSLYMNRVYFGAGTYGVDAAARIYFGRSARKIGLYESALIAGLLKAPSRYNPRSSASRAEKRTDLVLQAMVDAGFITEQQADKARKTAPSLHRPRVGQGRFFADWVLRQVDDYIGNYRGDIVVYTTLSAQKQRIAEQKMAAALEAGKKRGVGQGAMVMMAPDGAVTAMIGGRDYQASQFNRATQALRQPGSAFKSFVFLAGLESGLTPDSRFTDRPIKVGKWKPGNYGNKYYGEVTLREAFARSLNSVAVQVSEQSGRAKVVETARRLGIDSKLNPQPAIALGASEVTLLEMTAAYAVFANGGYAVEPYGIREIQDRNRNLLYRREGSGLGRVVKKKHVAMMNNMMSAVVDWGTGKAAKFGRPAAGKTGTTQDYRDALFVGYTPNNVAGIWFGNDDGRPMKGMTGGSLPAHTWGQVMQSVEQGTPVAELPQEVPTVFEETLDEAGGFLTNLFKRLKGEGEGGSGSGGSDSGSSGGSSQSGESNRIPPEKRGTNKFK